MQQKPKTQIPKWKFLMVQTLHIQLYYIQMKFIQYQHHRGIHHVFPVVPQRSGFSASISVSCATPLDRECTQICASTRDTTPGPGKKLHEKNMFTANIQLAKRSRRPWATGVFFVAPFVHCALCSFVLAPFSASVASFGQLFEKVQWNIPRQVNLSCLNISIYIYMYIIYHIILYHIILYYIILYYIILC